MKLIENFKMEPFSRIAWVSAKVRETWEPVIRDCSSLVSDLEVESVAAGQRPCSWQTMRREALPDFTKRCAEKGLSVLPVRWIGEFNGFIHYTPEGDSSVYCIIARRLEDALTFRAAFDRGDHEAQGEMLGFPKCCREAFAANWKAGFFDPIWQAAEETLCDCVDSVALPWKMVNDKWVNIKLNHSHPYSNPLLRYVGLRVGFHIPCSFSCSETISAGKDRLALAKDQELVKLLEALLSMPIEATLLHGILVVKTPIFYLINYSVPTEEKYTIKVEGKFILKEGQCRAKAKE